MKIICPKCKTQIENNNINAAENICVCQSCNELFKLSELLDQDTIDDAERMLDNPPEGTWVKKDMSTTVAGVSTHTKNSYILALFALAFSAISLFIFSKALATGNILVVIFVSTFVGFSVYLWIKVIFSMFGKIELVMTHNEDYLFIGVRSIGQKYLLNWSEIKDIYDQTLVNSRGVHLKNIYIDGDKLIKIPTESIDKTKSDFLIKILKYYKDKKRRFY
ncbi:MAG: YfjD family protein [Treponema sp.]|nr:YfjD family protein [Treponema sp.]MCL2252192.1 YfjD family protein [Treponema sp.]